MQQRYLKNNDVLRIIQDKEKNEVDIYKEIEEIIRKYHINNFSKNGKGQANELVEYLLSRKTFSNFIKKLWKVF